MGYLGVICDDFSNGDILLGPFKLEEEKLIGQKDIFCSQGRYLAGSLVNESDTDEM